MFDWLRAEDVWVPALIFVAEASVLTIATLRTIFVARGRTVLAPTLGFFEVLIWLFAVTRTMQNLDHASCFVAFALGFTFGNFLGMRIETWLALGMVNVRIITPHNPRELVERLRGANFGVTCVAGQGAKGPVQIVMTVVKRRQLATVRNLIETYQPHAFYAIDELQATADGVFPKRVDQARGLVPLALRFFRIGRPTSGVFSRPPVAGV